MWSHEIKHKIDEIIVYASKLYDRNFVSGTSGNISVKYDDKILITESGSSFSDLKYNNFILIDKKGEIVDRGQSQGKPSKETKLHLYMYEKNNINAVIHVHPTYITAYASAGVALPNSTSVSRNKLSNFPIVEYKKSGTQELVDSIKHTDEMHRGDIIKGYVLKNHGIIVGDVNLLSCYNLIDTAEDCARKDFVFQVIEFINNKNM